MSEASYLGQTTDAILGQEFLTWLWYQSETRPDSFVCKEIPFTVYMAQRVVVQGGEGDALETATVSGASSPLREARLGLVTGKKVTRALVRFERDADAWQISLKAEDFTMNSLKTPPVAKPAEDDDPDAVFFEKIYLIEECLQFFDAIYAQFLKIRLSREWNAEIGQMRDWIMKQD